MNREPSDVSGIAHHDFMDGLPARDRSVLAFEETWGNHRGAKEEAIRGTFGHSPARYYQRLGEIIDKPAALIEAPMLVKRLLNGREQRAKARASRVFLF